MTDNRGILDQQRCLEIVRSCACYNLRRAARATTRLYDDFLKPSGLRTTQYSVLMAAKLLGPLTLTKLAEMIVAERTTLTRNLTVLEKKGLVLIEPGEDRRERLVSLTEKGEEALIGAIPMWEAAQGCVEQGLGGERVSGLLGHLSAIISICRAPKCPLHDPPEA